MKDKILINDSFIEEVCEDIKSILSDFVVNDYSIYIDTEYFMYKGEATPNMLVLLNNDDYHRLNNTYNEDECSLLDSLKFMFCVTDLGYVCDVDCLDKLDDYVGQYDLAYYTDASVMNYLNELGCAQ